MTFRDSTTRETASYKARLHPTAVAAAAALALSSCSVSEGDRASESEKLKPEGEADQLTVVETENVVGVEEQRKTEEGAVTVEVAYPEIPNADPLTEHLGEIIEQELRNFEDAAPGPQTFTVDWNLSVASEDVIAVRLTQQEKDSEGERTHHATYWYDTGKGSTVSSSGLFDGAKEFRSFDTLVKEALEGEEHVDTSELYPIARLYDSIGFNPEGDLVVEFDQGRVAPEGEGRISAVVDGEDAAPLLSGFGEQAREAATVTTPDLQLAEAPRSEESAPSWETPHEAIPVHDDGVDCSTAGSKCVALTFDDGPGDRTPELLDMLNEYDAKATFFLTGGPMREHRETVRREYAEGHEIANHTVAHPDLTTAGHGEVTNELATVNALLRRETGYQANLMRPPYGATDDNVSEVSEELGLAQVLWSVDTYDWRDRDSDKVTKRVMKDVEPGSIVLMHDIHDTTIDAMPAVLERLDEKGYTMVTVSQLLGETEAGEVYRNGHPDSDKAAERGK